MKRRPRPHINAREIDEAYRSGKTIRQIFSDWEFASAVAELKDRYKRETNRH